MKAYIIQSEKKIEPFNEYSRREKEKDMKFEEFYICLKKHSINFATGVPCAALKKIFHCFLTDPDIIYIQAAREEDALGIATGAYFGGKNPIVLMQNSGLANSINALASLCIPYKIPILLLVTWRGCPDDKNEPSYHQIVGCSIMAIMQEIGVPTMVISKDDPETAIVASLSEIKERQMPCVMFLKRKGVLE